MKSTTKYFFLIYTPIICIILFSNSIRAEYHFNMFGHRAKPDYSNLSGAIEKEKIQLYNDLAFYFSFSSFDSTIYYAEETLRLEKIFPDPIQQANAYRHMGNAYALEAKYGRALFYLNQALNIFEDLNDYRRTAELYFDLGKLNYDLSDYDRTIAYSKKIEMLYKERNTEELIIATPLEYAIIIGLTGGAAREKGDYELAYRYFYEYIALSKQYEFPFRLNAMMTFSLAESYEFDQKYDSALKYFYIGRSVYPENSNKPQTEQTGRERRIGSLILRNGNPSAAIPVLKFAMVEDESEESYPYASSSSANLADAYLMLGKIDSALFYYHESLRLLKKMYGKNFGSIGDTTKPIVYGGYQYFFNINKTETRQIYYKLMTRTFDDLYNYYLKTGDSSKALIYIQHKLPYLDSLKLVTNEIELHKIQARYENENLEQQVNSLSKENENKEFLLQRNQLILILVLIIALLIIAFGIFFIRQNKISALHEKLLVEQKLLRSQMNPHFIFNSLASVQNFIVKQDDTNASIYLSRFSVLVRSILNNSLKEQITLEEEINTIENYFALQKIRFRDEFDFEINVDEKIDIENTHIPPMLAQPFIENCIEHGFRQMNTKGHISISFNRKSNKMILTIEDNGIGRQQAQENLKALDPDHKSMATEITRQRISAMNKKLKKKITLEIIDLKDEQGEAAGTKVVIQIPLEVQ